MKVNTQIMQHLDLLEALTRSTKLLLEVTTRSDIQLIEQVTNNRDRLINVIKSIQIAIENEIQSFTPGSIKPDQISILKSWSSEVNKIISMNDEIDQECLDKLEAQKEETTKEIATVYKTRQSFQGYDLSSVKK